MSKITNDSLAQDAL